MFNPQELILRAYPAPLSEFKFTASDRRVIACPNPPIEAVEAGKAIAIPGGEFEVGQVLAQLPKGFKPELVSLSARKMSFLPRGLERIPCPKVMKIGDTFHWEDGSLSGIIQYCQTLQCDYHWVYQGVQHLHFLVEAGLKNVFWLPGTPVIEQYIPQQPVQKSYGVIFRGSESALHTRRSRLLQFLQDTGIRVDIQRKSYTDCLEDYAKARIVLNFSLNGDTNRRVFEVLMAGGFLLTDRLSPQSGLFSLFQEGVHLECYGSESELFDKIKFYLQYPDKAEQIAATGQRKLLDCYSQQRMQQKLYRYALTNKIEFPFRLEHDRRVSAITQSTDQNRLKTRLKVYELIQELHRLNPQIKLLYWKGTNCGLLSDLADLPRLDLTYANYAGEIAHIEAWCSRTGVSEQVTLQSLPVDRFKQSFQIAIIDWSEQVAETQQRLQEAAQHVLESGLLVVVGAPKLLAKVRLRANNLLPVHLKAASTDIELGLGGCLIYQKVESLSHAVSVAPLIINELDLQTRLRRQLRSLPLAHQARVFVGRPFSR